MGLLGLLIRGTIGAVQDRNARKNLEGKLGRSVTEEEQYSLGAHLQAAQPNAQNTPLISTPRESSTPFADAKPPMKFTTKLLLIGIPLLFLGTIAVVGFVAIMPQRQYDRLNPFSPNPPAGTFPSALGKFSVLQKPEYVSPTSYSPGDSFESEYGSGADKVQYTLWVYKNADEMNAGYLKRKSSLKPSDKGNVVEDGDQRFAVAAESGFSNYILYKDGNNLRQISSYKQQLALEFEGLLKNAPPREVVAYTPKAATSTTGGSTTTTGDNSAVLKQLFDDYKKNDKDADKKYIDKSIIFSAKVAVAGKDDKGNPTISFYHPGSSNALDGLVLCTLDKTQQSAVSNVKANSFLTVSGKVGYFLAGNVLLDNCKLL